MEPNTVVMGIQAEGQINQIFEFTRSTRKMPTSSARYVLSVEKNWISSPALTSPSKSRKCAIA